LSLFLEIHEVFLQKTAIARTRFFSGFALTEFCGIALNLPGDREFFICECLQNGNSMRLNFETSFCYDNPASSKEPKLDNSFKQTKQSGQALCFCLFHALLFRFFVGKRRRLWYNQ